MDNISAELGKLAEGLRMSTVEVRVGAGGGTGVIWRDGTVVTNAHVARAEEAVVVLRDGRRVRSRVTRRDRYRDLALLHVEAPNLPAAVIGDSRALRSGELVVAVGNPLGLRQAVSAGVVHAVGPLPGLGDYRWVQSGLRLLPGNSGGPLADARGRVVGINSMVSNGLALSAPADEVERFLAQPSTGTRLGITTRPVAVRAPGGGALGLLILDVEPGGVAEASGLRVGDTLLAADGRPFETPADLPYRLSRRSAGGVLSIELSRGGKRLTIQARLAGLQAA